MASKPAAPLKPKHQNQLAAEAFADVARAAGYRNAKAIKTLAIGGVMVKNGWVVNIHDAAKGIGIGVSWYGRRRFRAWSEFHGEASAADDMSSAFLRFLQEHTRS